MSNLKPNFFNFIILSQKYLDISRYLFPNI